MIGLAQNNAFDKSVEDANKINGLLVDVIASFMEYPEVHSNTLIVYNKISTIRDACKNLQATKYEISNSIFIQPKVQQFYKIIDQTKMLADAFGDLLTPLTGYGSAGVPQARMNILLDPLFKAMGWKISILPVECKDAYFYEYERKGYKMMFIKSHLPPDDYKNNIFHNIEVTFTYDNGPYGGTYVVGGSKYRMIQFKDDENPHYYKVTRASSKRL
jgi:hypothetical protein